MKRTALFCLAIIMLLALTACGAAGGNSGSISAGASSESAGAVATDDIIIQRGYISDGIYKNDTIKIACTFDDGWVFYSDEELMELTGTASDYIDVDNYNEMLKNGTVVYEFIASTQENTLSMTVSKIPETASVDEETYVRMVSDGLDAEIAKSGVTLLDKDVYEDDFAGEKHHIIKLHIDFGEYGVYQRIVLINYFGYQYQITAVSYFEDTTDLVLAMFSPAE